MLKIRGGIFSVFIISAVFLSPVFPQEIDRFIENLYWNDGRLKLYNIYDNDGRIKAKVYYAQDGRIEKIEKFDINGNRIEESLFDAAGKLRIGIDGWAARRWVYDGNQVAIQTCFDETGKAIERKLFSESGRLLVRQYREGSDDINPYEAAAMYRLLGPRDVRYGDDQTKNERLN